MSQTTLTIDHRIPEETLGWSSADNLQLLCTLCNTGKSAFRRPLEALSSFAIGALVEVPRHRPFGALKQQIVVAALRSQGGVCFHCGRTNLHVELTVRGVRREDERVMQGFSPWNLCTVCYECDTEVVVDGNLAETASQAI